MSGMFLGTKYAAVNQQMRILPGNEAWQPKSLIVQKCSNRSLISAWCCKGGVN